MQGLGYDALLAPAESGSTLLITTSSINNGAGVVHLLLEHPTRGLPDCQALECSYSGIPLAATADISPESATGTDATFGGDCAGTTFPLQAGDEPEPRRTPGASTTSGKQRVSHWMRGKVSGPHIGGASSSG
jgi:hypothetical protein